jgi:prepilin-type N-terminal cleavage/methylation domain-containing protein
VEPTTSVARRGYTLSEVLVVLALMVTVSALAQPAVRKALGDSRLRSAARQVRAELAKTRLHAMESGVARRFRYQLGENRFETAPAGFDAEAEASESYARNGQTAAPGRADPIQAESNDPARKVVVQELPEGVSFESVDQELASNVDDEGWSHPIVFYPNGRAADAKIRLHGERNAVVDVSLRGLTGVATSGRPRHEKETQ